MSRSKEEISVEEIGVSGVGEQRRTSQNGDSNNEAIGLDDVEKDPANLKTEETVYDVYGNEEEHSIRYKTMSWVKCGVVMIAETIALGVLSLPSVLLTVGMLPGILLIIGLGVIATYTGYNLGLFRLNHPTVCNMADAGEILWGPFGKYLLGAGQVIFLVFICGSHCLTGAIAMNTLTDNATCKVVWALITGVVAFFLTLPRTLDRISYLSFVSSASILTSVFITIIGTGVESAPNGAPANPHIIVNTTTPASFYNAFSAVTDIIFAYAGHLAFFNFISEMKNPREYPKSLYLLQAVDITIYTLAGALVYKFTGQYTLSPSISSMSITLRKVTYGIAIPTILVAGVINGHVAAKFIFTRVFRGSRHLHEHTLIGWGTWVGLCALAWIIAWIISQVIPVFNDLLGLVASLFASQFTYGLTGYFWLFDNYGKWRKRPILAIINALVFALGLTILGLGMYASVKSIIVSYQTGQASTPFSCS
ncbi:N amino acid transport system protein [Galdieria sulphuraria]|nr:N amino acid transport system protein [Galdieria sulphuraria]